MLEGFELFEPAYIRSSRSQRRLRLGVAARPLVRFLLGNGIHLTESIPALRRGFPDTYICFRLVAGVARLHEIQINLRLLDVRYQLALLRTDPNILVPVSP